MERKVCMNSLCGITSTTEWKRGWGLRSGDFAYLCYDCGCAYENCIFCEKFHHGETGWRECTACNKLLHCGCIASKYFIEVLDFGGVKCTKCRTDSGVPSASVQIQKAEIPMDLGPPNNNNCGIWFTGSPHKINDFSEVDKNFQFGKIMEASKDDHLKQSLHPLKKKQEKLMHLSQEPVIEKYPKMWTSKLIMSDANVQEVPYVDMTPTQSSLTKPSKMSVWPPGFVSSVPLSEGGEPATVDSFLLPGQMVCGTSKPPNAGTTAVSELNRSLGCHTGTAKPPAEGHSRNQLLPRYWPRITDLELQQLSGDLNSAIVPLFEKVLSASDASRIGRLVLPKACAEAYFPSISQSEGVPLKMVDVKGKEWTFQFRFWPNNNSRMYVLEGVTPCLQSLQLQAGDTVTFSRVDPGGKIIMGFRKASSKPVDAQGGTRMGKGAGFWGETEGSPVGVVEGGCMSGKGGKGGKNMYRNIGSKTKRLVMPSEDVWELRITWEEAQDMLHPPPSVEPTLVVIENHEFEEYDEPPVFGNTNAYAVGEFGESWFEQEGVECRRVGVSPVDLNPDVNRGEEGRLGSMVGLVRAASLPLEVYMKEKGLASLVLQGSSFEC